MGQAVDLTGRVRRHRHIAHARAGLPDLRSAEEGRKPTRPLCGAGDRGEGPESGAGAHSADQHHRLHAGEAPPAHGRNAKLRLPLPPSAGPRRGRPDPGPWLRGDHELNPGQSAAGEADAAVFGHPDQVRARPCAPEPQGP